ncbi:hypothetical protein WR25_19892 [Diploscapter pachys]|uniref:Ground-like domain-containing protein n=1 Tax=Diploscapter pachys TaxID=2018661 RepID=A0A2A2LBH3_9BILA|nr:hypothetical protein WR25_19892 [Diploscapter pachys]
MLKLVVLLTLIPLSQSCFGMCGCGCGGGGMAIPSPCGCGGGSSFSSFGGNYASSGYSVPQSAGYASVPPPPPAPAYSVPTGPSYSSAPGPIAPMQSYIPGPQAGYQSEPAPAYAGSGQPSQYAGSQAVQPILAGAAVRSADGGIVAAEGAPASASTLQNQLPVTDVTADQVQEANKIADQISESFEGGAAASAAVVASGSKNAEVVEDTTPKVDEKKDTVKETNPTDTKKFETALGGTEKETTDKTAVAADEKVIDVSQLKLTNDPLCNSEDLRTLMRQNIDENLNSSKRLIQLAAEAQFGGRFDVICSNADFSYVTNTELYCQETKNNVSCYAYRQL